jgi:predicted RNA-binding Zn-ribbon protein involved in translation (DUF1610 family)
MALKIPSLKTLEKAALKGNVGFCVKCGKKVIGVEPDARKYECPKCGAKAVYGAEEIAITF